MSNEELRNQANRSSPFIKIAGGLWVTAAMIIMISAVVWVSLAVSTGDYFTNSKAVRDAAEAGSGLLSQQGTIEAFKDWVLPFAFLGLATFMLGFGLAFADILKNVRLRGDTMAAALPLIKQRQNG
ncbi:MAG: hypothetical protein IIB17_07875 [Chloroflexi bacterium]|nr:hypothetical protein [Chloroflexota bacterium]